MFTASQPPGPNIFLSGPQNPLPQAGLTGPDERGRIQKTDYFCGMNEFLRQRIPSMGICFFDKSTSTVGNCLQVQT